MAGASQGSSGDGEITGINVTPFVDIALVLLIIFMVTAKYLVATTVPVELPEAQTGTPVNSSVNVSIDHDGRVFLDTSPLDGPELTAALRTRRARNPELRVVIAADRAVAEGRVLETINLVRAADVSHFAIQTQTAVQIQ